VTDFCAEMYLVGAEEEEVVVEEVEVEESLILSV
jgi:hypothetical protein